MRQRYLLLLGLYFVATLVSAGKKMLHEVVSPINSNGMTGYAGSYAHSRHEAKETKNRKSANFGQRPITVRPLYISRRSTSTFHPSDDALRKVGRRPSTSTASPSIHWAADDADTCGGTINVPMTSDRISLFESSQFLVGRDYPLLCTWNVKASRSCGLARITMRLDGRSRLPDVKGCADGYYAVYPFMKQVKICGRIGDIPPLQWYVDIQQPQNVSIVMENIGLDDGHPEGLSFTLQGECIDYESDEEIIDIDKENDRLKRRWMKRLVEDFERGEGARVVKLSNPRRRTTSFTKPISSVESTTTTNQPTTTTSIEQSFTTTTRNPISYDDDSGIPWLILKSPDPHPISSEMFSPVTNSRASTTNGDPSRLLSSTTSSPALASKTNAQLPLVIPKFTPTGPRKIPSSSAIVYPEQSKPVANKTRPLDSSNTGYNYSNIPWLFLKSPDMIVSTSSTSPPYSPIVPFAALNGNPTNNKITPSTTVQLPSSNPPTVHILPTTHSPTTSTIALTTTDYSATATPIDVETTLPTTYSTTTPQWTTASQQTSLDPPLRTQSPIGVIDPPKSAPTDASTVFDDQSANDVSLSYISLNGHKFMFSKLQRTFQRTYHSLMKLVSN